MDPSGFAPSLAANMIGLILVGFYLFCALIVGLAFWVALRRSTPKTVHPGAQIESKFLMQSVMIKRKYTNWKGQTRYRLIKPQTLYYGSNEWHKEAQWLIDAIDLESGEIRTFALNGFK